MDENQKLTMMAMADHLQYNVTDEQFHMGLWMKAGEECGTVGCAIGHTAHMIHGLEMVKVIHEVPAGTFGFGPEFHGGAKAAALYGEEVVYGFPAVSLALGLSIEEANWLFAAGHYQAGLIELEGSRLIQGAPVRLSVYRVPRKSVYTRLRGFAKGDLECPL